MGSNASPEKHAVELGLDRDHSGHSMHATDIPAPVRNAARLMDSKKLPDTATRA
jgi:hypothetical protein